MKRIDVYRTQEGWIADHFVMSDATGWKPDQEVINLFGTHTLPTSFSAEAPEWEVVPALMKLNPEYKIVVNRYRFTLPRLLASADRRRDGG